MGVETNPGVNRVAVETKFRRLGVETYPGLSRVAVLTRFRRLGEETNPDVCRPLVVDTKERDETYPMVPSPTVVLVTSNDVTPEPLPPLIGALLNNKIPLLVLKLS